MSYNMNSAGFIDETLLFMSNCISGLTPKEQYAINNFIVGCKADGNWDYISGTNYRVIICNLYSQTNSLRSISSPTNTALIGSAVYTTRNLTVIGFDETGGAVNVNYSPPGGSLTLKTYDSINANICTSIVVANPSVNQTTLNARLTTLNTELISTDETLYIAIIGQSNGACISDHPIGTLTTYNYIYGFPLKRTSVFHKTTDNSSDNGGIELYYPANNDVVGSASNFYAVHATMAYKLTGTYFKNIVVIPCAVPSTRMAAGAAAGAGWNLADSGNLTDRSIQYFINKAIEKYPSKNAKLIIVDVHGESDSLDINYANAYYANKVAQYAKIRNTTGNGGTGFSNAPIIISQLRTDMYGTYVTTIRAAINDLAANLTNVQVFDTAPYPLASQLHYTGQGAIDYGLALATTINNLTSF